MKIPIYQADAFTTALFGGNPAAVCPLQEWLSDEMMQKIAVENNLSETAYLVKNNNDYDIRWFTPGTEVKLCGHATLAAAHILFTILGHSGNSITFHSKSGPLEVSRLDNGKLMLDFPSNVPEEMKDPPAGIFEGLGIDSAPVFKTSFDYMVVLPSQKKIEALTPDFKKLAQTPCRGIITTAKGDEADFVSRCFYPQSGIDEDPVTGSAHTIMVPFWAKQLNKPILKAIQLSKRRGYLDCELAGNRVLMSGNAVTYMRGEIEV
ncbi:MAG: PhzF family phenazine biosynthesis protein [Chitinophagaceae bacterium]